MKMNSIMKVAAMVAMIMMGSWVSPVRCGRGYTFTPVQATCRQTGWWCTAFEAKFCCPGLYCDGKGIGGYCKAEPGCYPQGHGCNLLTKSCCFPNICSSFDGNGRCVPHNYGSQPEFSLSA